MNFISKDGLGQRLWSYDLTALYKSIIIIIIMIGLLLREALDRLRVHLNMYLVCLGIDIAAHWDCWFKLRLSKSSY